MTNETTPEVDLPADTAIYGTNNVKIGITEDDRGYVQVTTPQGDGHTFPTDKADVESFVQKLSTDAGPALKPPENAPTDIESPPGWNAGIHHTGGGIWTIVFEKPFGPRRIEISINAHTPDGVSVGGYEENEWRGEITHVELDEPGYDRALRTAREFIDQIEAGALKNEVESVFE